MALRTVFLLVAVICFAVAALPIRTEPVNPMPTGLAFFAGAFLVG